MTEETPVKHNVRVVISFMNNERRTINFQDMEEKEVQDLVQTLNNSSGTIRQSDALLITGSDGVIVLANLKNCAFVEVYVD